MFITMYGLNIIHMLGHLPIFTVISVKYTYITQVKKLNYPVFNIIIHSQRDGAGGRNNILEFI